MREYERKKYREKGREHLVALNLTVLKMNTFPQHRKKIEICLTAVQILFYVILSEVTITQTTLN